MSRSKRFAKLSGLVAAAALVATSAVAGSSPRVTVGEIVARASAGADAGTETVLRSVVTREIEEMGLQRCKKTDAFVLSMSLVKLDSTASRGSARVSSVVSGTLRNATTGALVVAMRGTGTVEDSTPADKVKVRSLRTAVHGALARVPDVI